MTTFLLILGLKNQVKILNKEEEKKVQQVLVYTDFTNAGDMAVKHAVEVTKMFHGVLNILHVVDDNTLRLFKKQNAAERTAEILEEIRAQIEKEAQIVVRARFEEGCTCTILNSFAEEISAAIIITGIHSSEELQYLTPASALKIIRKSRIPYLIVKENSSVEHAYAKLVLPVNHMKESKEKISWAAYFGKLNKSVIHIFLPAKPDDLTKNNLLFARKFLKQFDVDFIEVNSGRSAMRLNRDAISYASGLEHKAMVVIMNTGTYGLLDHIFGPAEKKYIANKYAVPVLSLNPRSDLYVPCV